MGIGVIDPAFEEIFHNEGPILKLDVSVTEEFKLYQKQHLEIYNRRIRLLNRLRHPNKEKRYHAKKFLDTYYRYNPAAFIEDWVTTYDPRQATAYMPFALFPRQKEFITWLVQRYLNKEDGLVEKSRDMGLTWLMVGISIWMWKYFKGVKFTFASRKEILVDRIGDPDSIFEKIRIALRQMPKEILPQGYNEAAHATHLKLLNPENGAVISGEAGDQIGRGGRSSIVAKDESAFYERPEKIEAALSQNSDCKIDISTPNGMGNPFYQKRFSGKIPVFVFDWRDDPRKDQAWYDEQVEKNTPIIVAQEIDRDYAASVEGICIPAKYVKACIGFPLEDDGEWFGAFDVANEGGDKNAVGARKGVVVKHVRGWKEGNTSDNTDTVYDELTALGCQICGYDSDGVGAGVKGEASRIAEREVKETGIKRFSFVGISSGGKVSSGWFSENRRKKDVYDNHKAENWWQMRIRMEKTWKVVNKIQDYPADELISLPEINAENREHMEQLIVELSTPKYKRSDKGKIKIESKDELKKRGVPSPDYADMLVNLFSEKLYTVDFEETQVVTSSVAEVADDFTLNGSTHSDIASELNF